MRLFLRTFITLVTVLLLSVSCEDDVPNYKKDQPTDDPVSVTGHLDVANLQIDVVTDTENVSDIAKNVASAPSTADFSIEILDAQNVPVQQFAYKNKPAEPIELPIGNYTLKVSSGEMSDAAWDAPIYVAEKNIAISRDASVKVEKIACPLANVKVSVRFSDKIFEFLSADTKAEVSLGGAKLAFVKGETRDAYFKAEALNNTMTLAVSGQLDGEDVALNSTYEGVKAGQWRRIEVVMERKSPAPQIEWVGYDMNVRHTITETMTAVINISAAAGISGLSVDIISDILTPEVLTSIGLDTHLDLVNPATPEMGDMLKELGFPVGAQITDQTALTFDISPFMPLIPMLGTGNTDFKLTVTDNNNQTTISSIMVLAEPQK